MTDRRDRELFEALRSRLRSAGLRSSPWLEPSIETAAAIAEVVEAQLAAEVARVRPVAFMEWASSMLAESQDERYHARMRPAGKTIRGAQHVQWLTQHAFAARVLIERGLRNRADGTHRVNAPSAQRMFSLACQAFEAHAATARFRCGLCHIERIELSRDGGVRFLVVEAPPFRLMGFERALVDRMAATRREDDADVTAAKELIAAVRSGGSIPAEFSEIDAGLRGSRGFGLAELITALAVLGLISGGDDRSVAGARFTPGRLADAVIKCAREAFPAVDSAAVAAALPHLTWTQELLRVTSLAIADYQAVPARLLSRPVLEMVDGSLFVPRTAPEYAGVTLLQRVFEGTWIEDLTPNDEPLRRALGRRRERVRPIDGFENEIKQILRRSGRRHATNVHQGPLGEPAQIGVPLRFELDGVVAIPERSELLVLEAKDLAIPFSPRRTRSELDKYQRENGHLKKLSRKVEDVASDPAAVATHLGAPTAPYRPRGVFVTRELTPAAFLDGVDHEFVLIDDFARYLE